MVWVTFRKKVCDIVEGYNEILDAMYNYLKTIIVENPHVVKAKQV